MHNSKAIKYMLCPKCGIRRFFVKNISGETVVVQVTSNFDIVPVDEKQNLDGFDLEVLYCLGCSWKGRKEKLISYLRQG